MTVLLNKEADGKIRFLVEMYDFHVWTLGAMWEDIKLDISHYAHIERVALVGDRNWENEDIVTPQPR